MNEGLLAQIDAAREHIRHMKTYMPNIFPQWTRLKHAQSQLKSAQKEVDAAQAAWDALGESSK